MSYGKMWLDKLGPVGRKPGVLNRLRRAAVEVYAG